MRSQRITKQVIAFVAAGVIVFTGIDVFIVWRNQSAQRVMMTQDGNLVYQTTDYAIGSVNRGGTLQATILRMSPDGGWSLEGSGPWLDAAKTASYGQFAILRNLSSGPAIGAYWLCAVVHDHALTSVQLYNTETHRVEDEYTFHRGGVIEPIMIHPGTELRLMNGSTAQLEIPIQVSQIP